MFKKIFRDIKSSYEYEEMKKEVKKMHSDRTCHVEMCDCFISLVEDATENFLKNVLPIEYLKKQKSIRRSQNDNIEEFNIKWQKRKDKTQYLAIYSNIYDRLEKFRKAYELFVETIESPEIISLQKSSDEILENNPNYKPCFKNHKKYYESLYKRFRGEFEKVCKGTDGLDQEYSLLRKYDEEMQKKEEEEQRYDEGRKQQREVI